jgi:hypothetical protein
MSVLLTTFKRLIFRYDNASHKPVLSQPEHKHTPQGIVLSQALSLADIIDEILKQSEI